jgi:Mrp family chromosome partitioning ATPase
VLSEAKAMQFVLKTAAEQYDWVIVDASTLHNCADAVTLSQYTDGLILVVRPGFVRQDILNQILSDLRSGGGMVLGSVLNETIIPEEEEEFHVGKASRNLRQWLVRSRDLQNQNIGSIS